MGGALPRNVPFELYAGNKHPTQNTASGGRFLGLAKPLRKNSEISHGCTLLFESCTVYTDYYLFMFAPCTIFFCIHLIYILINIRLSAIDGITYLVACHYSLIALFSVIFCVLIYVANKLFLSVFQTWSKSVQDKCPKGRVAGLLATENKTKHVLAEFGGTRWRFPHFCASAHCGPTHIPGFSQIRLGLGSYNRKTCDHPK